MSKSSFIDQGRSTKAELIMPLPGETKETFVKGLNNVLNSRASSVTIYTLMMLHGTEFKNPDFRKKYNYVFKLIVPLNFGKNIPKQYVEIKKLVFQQKICHLMNICHLER